MAQLPLSQQLQLSELSVHDVDACHRRQGHELMNIDAP
jgi:hypothetical protein